MDVGAGSSGLPRCNSGMVLTECEVLLVESDSKKVAFMRTALSETNAKATIHHARIEKISCRN